MQALEIGLEQARLVARVHDREEARLATTERALEVAFAAVGSLWDALDGVELRDSVVRLVSALERECRNKALLAADILEAFGVPADDAKRTDLVARAMR